MRLKALILFLALSGLGFTPALAHDAVWIGLYFAKDAPPPPGASLASPDLAVQLRQIFGFKHYELLKERRIELGHEWEQWVIPRNDFFIRLLPHHRGPGGPRIVDYEIYKDGFPIVTGKFELHEGTPLFINGPDYRHGRFIFVLAAR